MSVFNLGVVFGPTLLRPLEETVAAILDIKFNNIVINILIENYERIFKNDPNISAGLLSANATSPPTRTPRTNQGGAGSAGKYSVGGVGGGNMSAGGGVNHSGRNSMYSPQQNVYRVVAKSNYTNEPVMSSSMQNIPNSMIYAHGMGGGGAADGDGTAAAIGCVLQLLGGMRIACQIRA